MKRYIKAAKTLEDYEQMGVFDNRQMNAIREGLENGIDVSWYADPKYDEGQMFSILDGLKKGVDVSVYADPKYSANQMNKIRQGLESGVDVSWYADPKYTGDQMYQILLGLEKGLDVSTYANPKYSSSQMKKFRGFQKPATSKKRKKTAKTSQPQRNRGANAKTIEDYVIYGLPDSTGEKFDIVKYVEIVNDNPEYWELSGSDFHDKAFELFERDMERKFPEDEINDDVETKFYDDISGYGYYDEEW